MFPPKLQAPCLLQAECIIESSLGLAGADDKAAAARTGMLPPTPRPPKVLPKAGFLGGRKSMMYTGSTVSSGEPSLGPPQWRASKVRSPVPSLACAQLAVAQRLLDSYIEGLASV